MKKIFLSLLVLAATFNAFAIDYTAKATLTLTDTDGDACEIVIAQSDQTDISKYCAEMYMENRAIAIYVSANDKKYELYAANDLTGIAFGIMPKEGVTDYTLTVTDQEGEVLIFKDNVTGATYPMTKGAIIPLANVTAETITSFQVADAATPVEPNICHRYGKLEVYGSNRKSVEILSQNGATSIYTKVMTSDYQEINLADVLAGQTAEYFMVKWNGKDLIIKK
ncbi:MAG: hypothetical protein IJS00_00765 [Paludibacteraceae bacterium]|nr:hypothetical protein [Paludibacteraceae bacterium]